MTGPDPVYLFLAIGAFGLIMAVLDLLDDR
jgi:hypothetical protein